MLAIKQFNEDDIEKLESSTKSLKLSAVLILLFIIPLSLFFGLFGLTKNGFGYWLTTIVIFSFQFLASMFYLLRKGFLYLKDKKNKTKFAGIVTVLDKYSKKENVIFINDSKLNKIQLPSNEQSEKVKIGDILYIEYSVFSKLILKVAKDNIDLLEK